MEELFVAVCDVCGVMVVFHDSEDAKRIAADALADETEPLVARCGILFVTDAGTEECTGDLVLRGKLSLTSL